MKSGNLNFLEHSGPLQACNGTDLPYYFWAVSDGHSNEQNDTAAGFIPGTPFFPCRCHSTVVPDPFILPSHTDVLQSQHVSMSAVNTQAETSPCNYTAR